MLEIYWALEPTATFPVPYLPQFVAAKDHIGSPWPTGSQFPRDDKQTPGLAGL